MRTRRNPKLHHFARELRKDMTDAEHRLWRRLRGGQLHGIKFRRQYVIGSYIADFAALKSGWLSNWTADNTPINKPTTSNATCFCNTRATASCASGITTCCNKPKAS